MARSAKTSGTQTKNASRRSMSATQLLRKDHETVKALFHRYEKAGDRAYETKQKVVAEIERALAVHTTIEEEIFYPAVQDEAPGAKDLVQEAYEEHGVAKSLLRELGAMSAEDDQYDAKVKVLQENIEHHVQEEEGEMFPRAEELGAERLKDLGAEMQARKDALGQTTLTRIMNGVSGLIFGTGESDQHAEDDETSGAATVRGGKSPRRALTASKRQNAAETAAGRKAAKPARSRNAKETTARRAGAQKRATANAKKRTSGRSAGARGSADRRASAKKQRGTSGAGAGGRRRMSAKKTAKKR